MMATINATVSDGQGGKEYLWETITESDTAATQLVESGTYTATVEGTFGSGSIEIQYGKESGNEASIDSTNLSFSANGSYNIEIGRGHVLPVRTGGSSMDVDVTLTPIRTSY